MNETVNIPFVFSFSFIIGIALGLWFNLGLLWLFLASGILIFLVLLYIFRRKTPVLLVVFFLLALTLGYGWAGIKTKKLNYLYNQKISKETSFTAKITSEKETREKYAIYTIKTKNNKILLLTDKGTNYKYGDILQLTGKLETPSKINDFNYQGYLAKDSIYYQIHFPKIELKQKSSEKLINSLYNIKSKIRKNIIKNFPQRETIFLRSIILGDSGLINKEFRKKLSLSGTSHIVAISGLHLSVLAIFIFGGLLLIGFWRKQASIITIIILILFAIFIGFKASLVRAVFMASLLFISLVLGKIFQGERIVTYVAFLMLFYNPLLLKYDVGFQMSFLAVLGIFLLKPIFDYLFNKKLKLSQILTDILTVTLSAQFFTLPIIIYNFGIFSLIAPFANFFILLILPFALGLGFLWALLSILINPYILTLILQPLLKTILNFIYWTGSLKWSAIKIDNNISLLFFLVYYVVLALIIVLWKKSYQKYLTPLALWQAWQYEEKFK